MRKTNLKAYSFYDRDKIIWLYHTTENINLFMVKVDKKENIWLYTFYIILLLVFDLLIINLFLDCLTVLIYQQ